MPITFGVFVCGYLAIIGFPPFTGFFTKDKIIEAAFDKGGTSGWILGICALLGAGLTAFYMTRALVMTFFGERRWEDDVHPHEAPPIMTVPMIVLGVLSLVGGYLLDLRRRRAALARRPSVGQAGGGRRAHDLAGRADACSPWSSWPFGVAGGYVAFGRGRCRSAAAGRHRRSRVAARRNLYADAFNEAVLMRPGPVADPRRWSSSTTAASTARSTASAAGLGGGSARLRRMQTGFVRSYALSMLGGAVAVVAVLLAVRFQ